MSEVAPTQNRPRTVTAVIPVHNRRDVTLHCLRSLHESELTGLTLRVVVVDDGSTDGTAPAIAEQFPQVVVLPGDGNLWWPGAVNIGITHALRAGTDYLLIVNDDSHHDRHAIRQLVSTSDTHPKSMVGALILSHDEPDRVVFGGAFWSLRSIGWAYPHAGLKADQVPSLPWPVDFINGNFLLMPAEVIRQVGLYDAASFPHAYADIEFTARARRAGWKLLIDPAARVWNHVTPRPKAMRHSSWPEIRQTLWSDRRHHKNLRTRMVALARTAPTQVSGGAAIALELGRFLARLGVRVTRPIWSQLHTAA